MRVLINYSAISELLRMKGIMLEVITMFLSISYSPPQLHKQGFVLKSQSMNHENKSTYMYI